ncbi:MAG: transporter substrate-binding domain-containing protein, partial [Pseudomonadota bacterium]
MGRVALLLAVACLGTCSEAPDWLDHVKATGKLVVVTRNSPTTYYLGHDTEPTGPDYDLVRRFADSLGVTLDIQPRDSLEALFSAVANGDAHMAAAGLSITDRRQSRLTFSEPYQQVRQQLVYKLGTGRPRSVEEIFGRDIVVLRGSSHAETLRQIKADHPRLTWREVDRKEVGDLLAEVAAGSIELTVADSNEFDVHRNFLPEIRVAFDLGVDDALAFAFAKDHSRNLTTEADRFLARVRRDGRLARILDRYYGHTDELD